MKKQLKLNCQDLNTEQIPEEVVKRVSVKRKVIIMGKSSSWGKKRRVMRRLREFEKNEIRKIKHTGISYQKIADQYKVCPDTIYRICKCV